MRDRLLRVARSRRAPQSRSGEPGNEQTVTSAITPLARALAALADARAGLALDFSAAVERLDEADRVYRTTIETVLPPAKAHALLQSMLAFRNAIAELRERTRAQTGYGEFDPLDTYVPSIAASHAQAVRAANTADIARGRVADLRADVNTRIGALLDRTEIERLIEAKRVRNAAFDRAVREALPGATTDQLATTLMLLADGWY